MVSNHRVLFLLLICFGMVSCSPSRVFIDDPQFASLQNTHNFFSIRFSLWLSGYRSVYPDDFQQLEENLSQSDPERVILTPYWWTDREKIKNIFPEVQLIWTEIPQENAEEETLTVYTDWDWPRSRKTDKLKAYYRGRSILLLFTQDTLSGKMAESFQTYLEDSEISITPVGIKMTDWDSVLEELSLDEYEELVLFTGPVTVDLLEYLEKWNIPAGGEIPYPGDIPWTFQIGTDWRGVLKEAKVQARRGDSGQSVGVEPEIRVNTGIIGKKSTSD